MVGEFVRLFNPVGCTQLCGELGLSQFAQKVAILRKTGMLRGDASVDF
jgi:hypothetical protein